MKYITKLLGLLLVSIGLTACGGGGGSIDKKVKVFRLVSEVSSRSLIVYHYDDNGLLVKSDKDEDGNGIIEEYERYFTYTYNGQGRLLTKSDHYADGEVYTVKTFNEYGDDITTTYSKRGTTEIHRTWHEEYTYDSEGRKVFWKHDNRGDGWDVYRSFFYEGRKKIYLNHVGTTDEIKHMTVSTYGEKGYRIKREYVVRPQTETVFLVEESATYADIYALVGEGNDKLNVKRTTTYENTYDDNGNIEMRVNGNVVRNYIWGEFEVPEKYSKLKSIISLD